ncbi:MAG TPA: hypothetical protein PKM73_14690 [Verrucomicrobiota bacterium]|nr:hypothetical protein [Verrucomicrobiota bacterium]HNU52649.1 hypothetical protein [Verrucomicrobiota bacterium]
MLALIRIVLTVGLAYGLMQAARNAEAAPATGDLTNAFWLAYCVVVGFLAAIAWAPWLGTKLADPLTGVITDTACAEAGGRLMRVIRWFARRGRIRWVRWLCFIEGVRHPDSPAPFITGLDHARPGSWLERIYAREVYRFSNTRQCIRAHQILKDHGVVPPRHPNPEVQLVLMSIEKAARPDAPTLAVPPSSPPGLQRNERIRLFDAGESPAKPPDRGEQPSDQKPDPGGTP